MASVRNELLTYQKSNEWDFSYKNKKCVNTVQSTFHVVLCLSYTHRGIQDYASRLFQILSIKFVPTYRYKKYNLSLCLVLFSPSVVILPALYNFLHWQWSMENYSTLISELFFTFLRENVSPHTNFHVEC